MPNGVTELDIVASIARRIFGTARSISVERVPEGVSTHVYRLRRGDEVFYLRVLPEEDASFAPEVFAHATLLARGVRAPAIVYWEHVNPVLDRSVMVTTEIPGRSLAYSDVKDAHHILRAAGRDLALINMLPVEGFGWIRRDTADVSRLQAIHVTNRAFIMDHLDPDLALLEAHGISARTAHAVRAIVQRHDAWLDTPAAYLAHGDFDVTHIYAQNGHYTGIIDFGEIRGADALYDLGHFRMHDGETLPHELLPHLLAGYAEVAPLPDDHLPRISFLSLAIAIRTLARFLDKRPLNPRGHIAYSIIEREIRTLRPEIPH